MAERSGTTTEGGGEAAFEERLQGRNTNTPRCSGFSWICKWQVKVGCKKYDEREDILLCLLSRYIPAQLNTVLLFLHRCSLFLTVPDIFLPVKRVAYQSPAGQYFTPICLSMVAVRAQPCWPLEGLTFRNIFLFSTHLFSSVRNEGKDTRLKGEPRRLASSSHPSALRQRLFRLRRRAPSTDYNAGAMPITLATWALIVTFHYGQW